MCIRDRYNRDHWLDIAAYKAPTDPVYLEAHGLDLFVGRRVKLESRKYFPEKGFPRFLDSLKEGDVKSEYLLPRIIDDLEPRLLHLRL